MNFESKIVNYFIKTAYFKFLQRTRVLFLYASYSLFSFGIKIENLLKLIYNYFLYREKSEELI